MPTEQLQILEYILYEYIVTDEKCPILIDWTVHRQLSKQYRKKIQLRPRSILYIKKAYEAKQLEKLNIRFKIENSILNDIIKSLE